MIDIDETFKLTQGQGHKVSVSQYWKSNKHKSMSITGNDPILAHMERSWKPLSYANDTTHTGLKVFKLYKNDTSIVLKKQIDIFVMLWMRAYLLLAKK